jgi:hypothetical protein
MKPISKITSYFVFPALVLLAHGIASNVLDLYRVFPNLDIPFHFMGGFSIAYTATQVLCYLEKESITVVLNRVLFLVLILALTATATVFWEFAEFIGDKLLDTNIQIGLANTMQDQFMGILGGVTWISLSYKAITIGQGR